MCTKDQDIGPVELSPNELTRETLIRSARGEEVHRLQDTQDLFEQLGLGK